jgi:hypothetical protein
MSDRSKTQSHLKKDIPRLRRRTSSPIRDDLASRAYPVCR